MLACRCGLPASGRRHQRWFRSGPRGHAPDPYRRLAAQAVAAGNPSGRHPAPASRLLPRRIHLPLQSPALPRPRAALPPPRPAGRRRRAGTVPSDHRYQRLPSHPLPLGRRVLRGYPFSTIAHGEPVQRLVGPPASGARGDCRCPRTARSCRSRGRCRWRCTGRPGPYPREQQVPGRVAALDQRAQPPERAGRPQALLAKDLRGTKEVMNPSQWRRCENTRSSTCLSAAQSISAGASR